MRSSYILLRFIFFFFLINKRYPCDSTKNLPNSRTLLAYCGIIAAVNFAFSFLLPDATSEFLLPLPLKGDDDNDKHSNNNDKFIINEGDGEGDLVLQEIVHEEEATNNRFCETFKNCINHFRGIDQIRLSNNGSGDGGDIVSNGYINMGDDEQGNGVKKSRGQFQLVVEVVMLIIIIQAFLVWISVKEFVSTSTFYVVLSLLSVCVLFAAGWFYFGFRTDTATALKYGLPAVFLFLYNAMPSAQEQIFTFQFYLFFESSPCKITQLNLISSSASVVSFLVYGLVCNQRGIRSIIIMTTIISLLLGLLWLPLASLRLNDGDDMNPSKGECIQFTSQSCLASPFLFAAVVQFITSLSSMLAFTPSTVLATESTPFAHKTMAYAIFLSVIDSGSSASGWISSSIVTKLGITYDDWTHLPELIWITTACQLAALAVVPFLKDAQPPKKEEEEVDERSDNVGEEGDNSSVDVSLVGYQ
jgi:hypothetical protein